MTLGNDAMKNDKRKLFETNCNEILYFSYLGGEHATQPYNG